MGRKLLWVMAWLLLAGVFNLAAVRKKQDPIQQTQTDPILYDKKMEEIKDGEKGAPLPSIVYYAKNKFFVDPPVTDQRDSNLDIYAGVPYGEDLPEDLTGFEDEEAGDSWWLEEGDEPEEYDESGEFKTAEDMAD